MLPARNSEERLSSISTKSQRKSPPAHTLFSLQIKLAWHGAKDHKAPKKHLVPAAAAPRAGAQPARKWQFMSGELAVELSSNPSMNSSIMPLRLEYAPTTTENHVHCLPHLGSRRSLIVRGWNKLFLLALGFAGAMVGVIRCLIASPRKLAIVLHGKIAQAVAARGSNPGRRRCPTSV